MSELIPVEQKIVEFNGAEILGVKTNDGKIRVGVKWVCHGIGFDKNHSDAQVKKIQSDVVLSKGASNLTLPTNGGNQEVLTIELEFLPLWLAKISITPSMMENNPEITECLIDYQLKAKDVLAAAFLPQSTEVDNYLNMSEEDKAIAYFTAKKKQKEIERRTVELEEENRQKEEQLRLQAPKAALADMVVSAKNAQSMSIVSKVVGMGRNRLFNFLRDKKVFMPGSRVPYQKYIDAGYFIVKESPRQQGEEIVNDHVTRVTAKGLEFVSKLIRGDVA